MGSKNSVFECPGCKKVNDEAKIFPCNIYCIHCVNELLESVGNGPNEFFCPFCDETHLLPKNGFKDFNLNKINNQKFNKDESAENLYFYLKRIDTNIQDLKYKIDKSSDLISGQCSKLRDQIQAEVNNLIKNIEDLRDEKFEEINQYEKNCLSASIDKPKIEHNYVKECLSLRDQWKNYFESFLFQENEIKNANNFGEKILKKIKEEKAKVDLILFNGTIMEYHKSQHGLAKNVLGCFELRKTLKLSYKNASSTISIKNILPNLDSKNSQMPTIDILENQNVAVGFIDLNKIFT